MKHMCVIWKCVKFIVTLSFGPTQPHNSDIIISINSLLVLLKCIYTQYSAFVHVGELVCHLNVHPTRYDSSHVTTQWPLVMHG